MSSRITVRIWLKGAGWKSTREYLHRMALQTRRTHTFTRPPLQVASSIVYASHPLLQSALKLASSPAFMPRKNIPMSAPLFSRRAVDGAAPLSPVDDLPAAASQTRKTRERSLLSSASPPRKKPRSALDDLVAYVVNE